MAVDDLAEYYVWAWLTALVRECAKCLADIKSVTCVADLSFGLFVRKRELPKDPTVTKVVRFFCE